MSVLMFDHNFIRGTGLERHMDEFHFFNYNSNEALRLLPDEKRTITTLIKMIRYELKNNRDADFAVDIVRSYILLILQYCQRFYNRQFHEAASGRNDLLVRFRKVLENYYEKKLYIKGGMPGVSYCASELFLSPNYFGDLVKTATGDTASHYIRRFVVDRAKSMLVSGRQMTETAKASASSIPSTSQGCSGRKRECRHHSSLRHSKRNNYQLMHEFGIKKFLEKLVISLVFCNLIVVNQNIIGVLYTPRTQVEANTRNKLMPMWDKIMLWKRYIIECINELLKSKANLVHSRHRSIHNFIMNLCSALTAYCFFDSSNFHQHNRLTRQDVIDIFKKSL